MSPIAYTGTIIAVAVVLFVSNRIPVVLVAMMTALALWATGVLTLPQALGGLGDPAVIFIASLFVVSSGLEVTGVTAWAGQLLIKGAGEESRTRLLLFTMGLVAVLTALISVNGAVAALLPVVVVIAVRLKRNSSQLLMPLVFAAHAGSMLALTGTPVNVLVSEAGSDAGVGGFSFFEFALAGIPLLAGTMAIIILFGQRLLPERNGATMPADFSRHAKTLVEQYGLASGIYQMRVRASSPFIGMKPAEVALSDYPGLQLVAIQDGETAGPLRRPVVAEGDHLLVRGEAEAAALLAGDMHLAFRETGKAGQGEETLFNQRSGLAEVVIPPRSGLIGQTVFPGMVTESGDLIVLAVQRAGAELAAAKTAGEAGGIALQAGDTMLLQGTWKALDIHLDDPDVLVVSSPELVRRQAVPMGPGAKQAVIILFAMVLLLATGIVPPAVAGLLAAGAIILSGIMNVEQSYRAISWTTVILVGAMMPLSTAMVETGAAKLMAERLVYMVGDAGPIALLAGLFVLTAIMGQLISNTATALIVIPIGVAAATSMGISPKPVLMSTAVAAAGAFLTPIATPTNLMVMGPGGYAFGDYWKLGLPLLIWFFVVAVFLVPLIWRF
ncbi:SLC13 family permease [Chelatococcus asaccharovorans]|uniref:Citrate transporter n=1 Tax=Chelatococcus asaccharovorans TaxID=28210 RepID=A0A2V3U020_9HYPH|nr:SLC13 family permease [Chelatococcus asaccharovorans]MBS7707594.1 SLC13 family permease [Chelatococcus asaccharovorans]PXW55168.1 citrate transporter [Chelatococcus asaccharovorans]CAH1659057.1 Citrate transporter [Chelatococcus asaccharovorans]CAH1688199.1 Citrate transporter [Chelatococcus asaccharovorans]